MNTAKEKSCFIGFENSESEAIRAAFDFFSKEIDNNLMLRLNFFYENSIKIMNDQINILYHEYQMPLALNFYLRDIDLKILRYVVITYYGNLLNIFPQGEYLINGYLEKVKTLINRLNESVKILSM